MSNRPAHLISLALPALAVVVGLGLATAAAAQPDSGSAAKLASNSSEARASKPGKTIKDAESQFGDVLFDRGGQAVYYFAIEGRGEKPQCYDACADAWPPVLTKGKPRARGDVRQGKLGTVKRSDGKKQVTYLGRPLYYYAHEGKDVVLCHDVFSFGGSWYAVLPGGKPAPH